MTFEARVDALEHDMAALRAETRGWAAYAVAADQKAGAAGELLSLVRQDVNDIKAQVTGHTETLSEHGQILNEHTAILNEHTTILNEHTTILNEHGQMLREILDRVA
jgi:hypothetical protein